VPAVSAADLILPAPAEGSANAAARVAAARELQRARYSALGLPGLTTNAAAPAALIEDIARPDTAGSNLVRDAAERMRLSARGFHRVLKLARTIADLADRHWCAASISRRRCHTGRAARQHRWRRE